VIEFTRTHLDAAIEYANKLWAAIMQQESDEKKDNVEQSRVEQQLLHLARLVSRQVASTYSSLVPLNESTTDGSVHSEELSGSPAVLSAVRDKVLWMFGMLRLIPQLLPMYVYGLASWIDEYRNKNKVQNNETVKENGTVVNHHNHNNTNHAQEKLAEDYSNSSEHLSDSSIPEEDEEES